MMRECSHANRGGFCPSQEARTPKKGGKWRPYALEIISYFLILTPSSSIHLDHHVANDVRSFVHPVRTPVEMSVDFSEAEHNAWIVS